MELTLSIPFDDIMLPQFGSGINLVYEPGFPFEAEESEVSVFLMMNLPSLLESHL